MKVVEVNTEEAFRHYGIVDPRDEDAVQERIKLTCSFLHMLRNENLIICKASPDIASLNTRKRIQSMTYLAFRVFDLPLGYWYNLYIYGPYSVTLATEYYQIPNVRKHEAITTKEWPKMDEFLDFVRRQDTDWLEVVTTLHYIAAKERIAGDKLVSRVSDLCHVLGIKAAYDKVNKASFWDKARYLL